MADDIAKLVGRVNNIICGSPICDDNSLNCQDCKKLSDAVEVLERIEAAKLLELLDYHITHNIY